MDFIAHYNYVTFISLFLYTPIKVLCLVLFLFFFFYLKQDMQENKEIHFKK